MPELKHQPAWLRSNTLGAPAKVDREAGIIYGRVVAELGTFKDRRGKFDSGSLSRIVELMAANPNGTKSRFTHPTLSADGLGKFLGRDKSPRLDGPRVRADLHLDASAYKTPSGDLASYVMDLAESDPGAFGSSLVLQTEKIYELDDRGRPKRDANGDEIPPLWMPTKIHAIDVVDDGDAVHGDFMATAISFDDLPDFEVRKGAAMLDHLFAGQPRDVVHARCTAWLERYLSNRYGSTPSLDTLKRRLAMRRLT